MSCLSAGAPALAQYYRKQKEVVARHGVVASCDDRATEEGLRVLQEGGNAVDAAVTIAFLMAVYEPYNSGIGGHGGHMALYHAETGRYLAIDASARAPARATSGMFEVVEDPPGHPGDLHGMGYNTTRSTHVFIEALKLAFMDRYEYSGDRDQVPAPYDGMMSWAYGGERAKAIDMVKASIFEPGDPWQYEGSGYKLYRESEGFHRAGQTETSPSDAFRGSGEEDTTFLCAADRHGNLLLLTTSLLRGFGSKVTVPGLGITLNSSMYSLSPKPGHP